MVNFAVQLSMDSNDRPAFIFKLYCSRNSIYHHALFAFADLVVQQRWLTPKMVRGKLSDKV